MSATATFQVSFSRGYLPLSPQTRPRAWFEQVGFSEDTLQEIDHLDIGEQVVLASRNEQTTIERVS